MVSLTFVYFFIPVFMALYAVIKPKHRGKAAVLAAVLFTVKAAPWGLAPMAVSVLSGYIGGIFIDNFRDNKAIKKLFLIISIFLNAAVFFIFAYSLYDPVDFIGGYLINGFSLRPFTAFGASVYTLHSISYCVDIYRKKYRCERSFMLIANYITFFPVLTAGPVLRYEQLKDSLRNPLITSEKLAGGIKLFLMGLAQKLLLGNSAYEIWENVCELKVSEISAVTAWIGIISFSFSFYYEFSGFSRMSQGISLMLGFEIPDNMKKPFMSSSFCSYLSKFNISVYKWFKEYIFDAVYGSSGKRFRCAEAAVTTAVLMSMWYGFGIRTLLFGLFILLMISVERLLEKPLSIIPAAVKGVFFNLVYLIGMPLLALKNPVDGFRYITVMFGFNNANGDMFAVYLLKTSLICILLCALFASSISGFLMKKINSVNSNVLSIAMPVWEITLMIMSTAFLCSGKTELFEFLY